GLLAVRAPYPVGRRIAPPARSFAGENPPAGVAIWHAGGGGRIEARRGGAAVASWEAAGPPGIHRVQWVPKEGGEYEIRLGGAARRVVVKAAPGGDS
ncbi:MAG: hypothetical protein K2W96_18575, partial [Gemmataceae bacterium]|nr:hypothetical protein [Gemmataceae bacterium]